MLINYFLVLTHTIKTITKEGDGYVYNPKLINNSKKNNKRNKCLTSVFISDKDKAKLYVQYFRPK